MKFSKKVLIPVILIVLICCIFASITIKNSKYPLPNIKSSEIKAMSIYHKGTSTFRTVQNSDGKKLLKYVKNITKTEISLNKMVNLFMRTLHLTCLVKMKITIILKFHFPELKN